MTFTARVFWRLLYETAGRTAPELQAKSRHQHLASLGHYVRLGEETSARVIAAGQVTAGRADAEEITGCWNALAAGATIEESSAPAVFSPLRQLADRFGVTWIIDVIPQYIG